MGFLFITYRITMQLRRIESLGLGRNGLNNALFNEGWEMYENTKPLEKYAIEVPGNIRLALMKADKIPDPFYAKNNEKSQWVSEREWIYENSLQLVPWKNINKEVDFNERLLHICFDAIDYDASFYINNSKICRQTGMFSPVDLILNPSRIEEERIDLKVKFHIQPFWRQHAVKSQMSFGWDFAPEIRTVGIWKDVRVYVTGSRFFTEGMLILKKNQNDNLTNLIFKGKISQVDPNSLETEKNQKIKNTLIIKILNQKREINLNCICEKEFEVDLGIFNLPLWNPWSLGEPNIISAQVHLINEEGKLCDIYQGKVVNRDVEWITNPGTIKGHEKWTLKINGSKLFLRGINWVPPDSLYGRISKERYVKLVDMAKEMNVDIIRVWGGGIEEKKGFYDYCDEQGVMVWQEFPFACTNYPDDKKYMEIVEKECEGIVERTRCHPSVVVYCGGNEFNPFINKHIITAVTNAVSKYAPDRYCFAASPYQGDDHNWRYWGMRRDLDAYNVNGTGPFQMLTEYGMQAAPQKETLKVCLKNPDEKDLSVHLEDLNYHKADYNGLKHYAEKYRKKLLTTSDLINTSQALQAYSLKYAIEICRSNWPNVSGVFPWQLSDPWPNISWSIVDYYYRPKLSFQILKNIYAPTVAMVKNWRKKKGKDSLRKGDLIVHNASQNDFRGSVKITVYTKNGNAKNIEENNKFSVNIKPLKALKIQEINIEAISNRFIKLEVRDEDETCLSTNICYPAMEPIPKRIRCLMDVFEARFDGWWRKHMTYLMELEKIREERPNWQKKKIEFLKRIKIQKN